MMGGSQAQQLFQTLVELADGEGCHGEISMHQRLSS
jgi:hypothetical protein